MIRRGVPFFVLALLAVALAAYLSTRPGSGSVSPAPETASPRPDPEVDTNRPPAWRPFLEAVLSGEDPRAAHFLAWLSGRATDEERREALAASLDVWLERRSHGLLPVLRAHGGEVPELLAPRLEGTPLPALELASSLFFPGGRRDSEAWKSKDLRTAVTALCQRSGNPARDLETGPVRAKALWLAGRARLGEAKSAILQAAGMAKDEEGHRVAADPHGSVVAVARRIVQENRRKRR